MSDAIPPGVSKSPSTELFLPKEMPPHPRLLAVKADWDRISQQIQSDPVSARIFAALEKKAQHLLAEPPLERVMIGVRLLAVTRQLLERVSILSMVFRITGKKAYADRAIQEMLAAASFSSWNPDHFLDVAEMSLAVAVGYDWLYDEMSESEREQIAQALIEKGLRPALSETNWWIDVNNNWNQVCHGGISAAAIAVADLQPEMVTQILKRAVEKVPTSARGYAPDGAYPEGPVYWNYGTSFHVILVEALQKFFGTAFGLDSYPGFKESATYMAEVTGPNGLYFNYADCREPRDFDVPLFWFARQFQRPDWLRFDFQKLDGALAECAKPGWNTRFIAFTLLWRDPSLVDDSKTAPPLHWLGRGENPVAMHRSAFEDPAASYIGIKGGSPSGNHAHMDAGSFVMEADGVRWALDLGLQEYESIESQGLNLWDRTQDSDRWTIFRLGSESHNILRFNGAPQLIEGDGQFIRFCSESSQPHSVLELSSLYRDQVDAVHRGVMFLHNKAILFQDEWTTGDKPVEAAWQMMTRAKVTVLPGAIRLEQDGKSLTLQVLAPAECTVEVKSAQELQKPFDTDNPGVQRIVIKTQTNPNSSGSFRLLAIPETASQIVPPAPQKLLDWSPAL